MPSDDGNNPGHEPVLVTQVLELLDPKPGQVVLDGTVGRGGHASAIIPRLAPGGRYIGLDADTDNVAYAKQRLAADSDLRVDIHHANFAGARVVMGELGVERVDGLLADLGFASNQMDDPSRGLSFQVEGPLDMRLDPTLDLTAADLIARLPEHELADVIYQYGEDRLSRKIARKIVEKRRESPIKTTTELARIVRQAYGPRAGRQTNIDPATRTFMALRIAVNRELEALEQLLEQLPLIMAPGGVAAIISFHSLEDRRVKQAFAGFDQGSLATRLTKKPVTADEVERQRNPRSRSAKLRAVRFT